MKARLLVMILVVLFGQGVLAQRSPQISEIDRIRLAEAFRLNEKFSETVWKDWGKTPLAVLLVNGEFEFLVGHPSPSKDFVEAGYDTLLKNKVYWRKRQFDPGFLATFPAIEGSGVSTVVVGQAENTYVKTSTPWAVIILHEHFHQMQDSRPDINRELLALDLTNGDRTGMWMLNYPFPYDDKRINEDFARMAGQLAKALETQGEKDFKREFREYIKMRRAFNSSLKEKDHKYLSFQLWKEGIARYTEYQIAKLAGTDYTPSEDFAKLADFQPYAQVAENIRKRIIESLKTIRLDQLKREIVYPYGAAEALLLDKAKIVWKPRYFKEKFFLDKYFEPAK